MNISILCKLPAIHEGIISFISEKYENIKSFNSIDKYLNYIDNYKKQNPNIDDTLLIVTLFKDDLKIINKILSIKNMYSNIKLLIIDFNEDNEMFFKISKLSIDGYMLNTFGKEDINYAISKISIGEKFYDREFLYRLVEAESASAIVSKTTHGNTLTKRELEILSQISNGLSNFEISKSLDISENTVKKHISNIFIKLNVKDRTQAIIYAYEYGLISKPLL